MLQLEEWFIELWEQKSLLVHYCMWWCYSLCSLVRYVYFTSTATLLLSFVCQFNLDFFSICGTVFYLLLSFISSYFIFPFLRHAWYMFLRLYIVRHDNCIWLIHIIYYVTRKYLHRVPCIKRLIIQAIFCPVDE
jgi:hypothetical protein